MPVAKPSVADFRSRFSEFSTTDDSDIERITEIAIQIYATSVDALLYLVAHILTLEAVDPKLDGGAGEVRVETIGKRSLEYVTQASDAGEAFYSTTFYGRTHLRMRRASPGRLAPRVIG